VAEDWSLAGRRVVLTGGAGFIGSHVAEAMVAAGAEVVVADNLTSGRRQNLARVEGRVRLAVSSLESDDLDVMAGADLVVHLAGIAYVPPSVESPLRDLDVNLLLTLRLLEWCRTNSPATRLILYSSAAVYGNPARLPADEDTALNPISPYGVSNLASERYGAVYCRLYGMPVSSLRCFAVYGPRQRKQVVYDVMRRMLDGNGRLTVLGDGGQRRDFCFVEDVARATLAVARRAPFGGEAWNVGGTQEVTIAQLVDMVGQALGLRSEPTFTGSIRPGDPEALVSDCSRLGALGWRPEVALEEGLRRTAAWLKEDSLSSHPAAS
jgi:UDP-glucose 4-epimerase